MIIFKIILISIFIYYMRFSVGQTYSSLIFWGIAFYLLNSNQMPSAFLIIPPDRIGVTQSGSWAFFVR